MENGKSEKTIYSITSGFVQTVKVEPPHHDWGFAATYLFG